MGEHGYLSIVLHAHLPYVRHPEYDEFLEEDWFFEAMTETYIPLIHVFERLHEDGVPFSLTISLSPTLLSMMNDSLLTGRYLRHLDGLIELALREVERTQWLPDFHRLALWLDCNSEFFGSYENTLAQSRGEVVWPTLD